MFCRPGLHPLFVALRAASRAIPAAFICSAALAQSANEAPATDSSAFDLPAQKMFSSETERADGPVDGYVAARSATGTNLDDETYYTTCPSRGDCLLGNRRTVVGTVSYSF